MIHDAAMHSFAYQYKDLFKKYKWSWPKSRCYILIFVIVLLVEIEDILTPVRLMCGLCE